LPLSRKQQGGFAPNFFQGLGENTCSLQPALKSIAPVLNLTSYFVYTDLISSLLDSRLVDPRSTLIHVGVFDPYLRKQ